MTELQERVIRGLRSPFTDVRLWACRSAQKKDLSLSIGEVRPLFADKSRRVQREAVRLAGLKRLSSAVPDLIEMLNSADSDLSLQAAVALNLISEREGRKGPPRTVPRLAQKVDDVEKSHHSPVTPFPATTSPTTTNLRFIPAPEPSVPRSIAPLPGEPEFDGPRREGSSIGILALVSVIAAFICGIFVGPALESQKGSSDVVDVRQTFAQLLNQLEKPEDKAALTKAFAQILDKSDLDNSDKGSDLRFDEGTLTKVDGRNDGDVHPNVDPTAVPTLKTNVEPPLTTPLKPNGNVTKTPLSTAHNGQGRVSSGKVSADDEDKVNLWVSMGYRYLESGRPKKVRALVESILEINPHSERAERLKRLARERYGDIE